MIQSDCKFNQTAMDGVRAMLQDNGLLPRFSPEALVAFVHIRNNSDYVKSVLRIKSDDLTDPEDHSRVDQELVEEILEIISPSNITNCERVERPSNTTERISIYYYSPNTKIVRLRSIKDVKKYCNEIYFG
ncbi:hypothetical protein CDAR_456771 [Caerostris darwini]|uniref:Uncharacterized protein n=1 Tax=Caerostris darwini TaxID=1538125 RepID=A0AAV4TMV9_9ARAC|nr:hypothetical protein CDAR_456771 [Caerostris darwini]